jgi:hypothetical protein
MRTIFGSPGVALVLVGRCARCGSGDGPIRAASAQSYSPGGGGVPLGPAEAAGVGVGVRGSRETFRKWKTRTSEVGYSSGGGVLERGVTT